MSPEELRVGDMVYMPWYGKTVPGRVTLVAADKVYVRPEVSGPHMARELIFKAGEGLEPITLEAIHLLDMGFFSPEDRPDVLILRRETPIHTWLEWHEGNKALFLGDSLIPTPICNIHQLQHILQDFNIKIEQQ